MKVKTFSNMFGIAYRGKKIDIRDTDFKHRQESCKYKSQYNSMGRAAIAKSSTEAIMALFNDSVLGIGLTKDNNLYIEFTGINDKRIVYQVLYDHQENINLYSDSVDFEATFPTRHFFIPVLISDIINKNQELLINLKGLKECVNRYGLPLPINDDTERYLFLSHEAFYYQHVKTDYYVLIDKIVGEEIKKDLTYDILGKDSDFKYVKSPKSKKHTKNTANKPIKVPSVDFKEPLSQEMLDKIPILPDYMKVPEKMVYVEKSIANGNVISFLQHGPSGGGKTTNVKMICRDIKLPLVSIINCTNNLDEFVLGKFLPESNGFVFYESDVTEAIEWGGAVVFEEFNFGNPKHMSFLNSLLDDNAFVKLDNGREIKRHPCFRFFATMNFDYAGTNDVNEALYNRFDAVLKVDDLTDEQIKAKLLNETSVKPQIANDMIIVYRKIQTKIKEEMREEVITPRNVVRWAKQSADSDVLTAAEFTMIPVAKDDDIFAEEIWDIVKMKF